MLSRLLWPVSVEDVLLGITGLKAVDRTSDFSAEV